MHAHAAEHEVELAGLEGAGARQEALFIVEDAAGQGEQGGGRVGVGAGVAEELGGGGVGGDELADALGEGRGGRARGVWVRVGAGEGAGDVAGVGAEVEGAGEVALYVLWEEDRVSAGFLLDVHVCVCACVLGSEEMGIASYQQSLAEPGGDLVLEIVGLSASLDVGRGPLLLHPLDAPVKDLKDGCTRGLEGVGPAGPGRRRRAEGGGGGGDPADSS